MRPYRRTVAALVGRPVGSGSASGVGQTRQRRGNAGRPLALAEGGVRRALGGRRRRGGQPRVAGRDVAELLKSVHRDDDGVIVRHQRISRRHETGLVASVATLGYPNMDRERRTGGALADCLLVRRGQHASIVTQVQAPCRRGRYPGQANHQDQHHDHGQADQSTHGHSVSLNFGQVEPTAFPQSWGTSLRAR